MSNCIKDFYEYDLIRKCFKRGNILLRSNFHQDKIKNDGFDPKCTFCRRKCYLENRNWIKKFYLHKRDRIKEYQLKNHNNIIARTKVYLNNRYRTDINFRLICKTRSKIRQALNRKTKSISKINILGIDIDTFRKWTEWQMIPEMKSNNIDIDHVKPICMFDISKEDEIKEAFCWKNTQPLHKQDHLHKGTEFNILDYQLHFIRAYQFIKLIDQEGPK